MGMRTTLQQRGSIDP